MLRPCLFLLCVLAVFPSVRGEDITRGQAEFFERKIRPVLVKQCYSCHSTKSKSVKAGLLLDTREGIRRGGESGHGVVPGNLDESLLIEAIKYEGLEMPPKKQLPPNVIDDFEKWVRMGAPDPREGKSAPIRNTIDFDKARDFWAFRPISTPKVPKPKNSDWAQSDIDRFVLKKLEAKQLAPTKDAAPRTLIRRVFFDLVGLPPTPEQVQQFVADPSRKNLERIVDELLASKHFGERWGRHWMDVVRYAESTGMERNYTYPEAWRYRDYVIAAFNQDKPFDRFLTEQVAGDLLTTDDKSQRAESLIATGMLALGPKSLNERNREKFAMDIVDEQIDVVSRAFLGLTASCARCHDHKFDPIPQAEYYQLAGIFRSTDTFYGTGGGGGNRQGGQLLAVRDDGVHPVSVSGGGGKKKASQNQLRKLTAQLKSQTKRLEKLKKQKSSAKQIEKLETAIARVQKQIRNAKKTQTPATPVKNGDTLVMAVQDGSNPGDTQLRIRGEADERGESIPRGYLTIATLAEPQAPPADASGRLELAQWLTQSENPLTARVAANRVWQHLFGQGIVRTVNNFGANGERPSHAELLDYLALQLRADQWSTKKLIRKIVLSRTYRQASSPNLNAAEIDPENRLLWRMSPRRLEAEAFRDAILAVSGQLDTTPAAQSIVKSIGNGDVGRNLRPERFATNDAKRSVYLPIVRGVVPEMLRIFDFPEPSIVAGSRDITTVPTQALYMMNSPFVVEQSTAMAERIMKADEDAAERIQLAYQLALARPATDAEVERSSEFIDEACKQKDHTETDAWTGFCQVLFASAEFRYVQ